MLALYSTHPQKAEAEREGQRVIERFLQDLKGWQDVYRSVGADDTASREAFAQEVARRLGIVRLTPNPKVHLRSLCERKVEPVVGNSESKGK